MFGTTIILALRSIRRHLLRSFLTILGVVIGVAAVVTMVTLGQATTAAVQKQIAALGTNVLQIRPGQGFGRGGGGPPPPPLKLDDVQPIAEQIAGLDRRIVGRAEQRAAERDGRSAVGHRRGAGAVVGREWHGGVLCGRDAAGSDFDVAGVGG